MYVPCAVCAFSLWDENFCLKHQMTLPVRRVGKGNWAALTNAVMLRNEKPFQTSLLEHPWSHFGCHKHTGIHFCCLTLASLPQLFIYCLPEPSRPLRFPPFQDSSSGRQLAASGCLTGLNIPAAEWNPIASNKLSQNQISTQGRLPNCYMTSCSN